MSKSGFNLGSSDKKILKGLQSTIPEEKHQWEHSLRTIFLRQYQIEAEEQRISIDAEGQSFFDYIYSTFLLDIQSENEQEKKLTERFEEIFNEVLGDLFTNGSYVQINRLTQYLVRRFSVFLNQWKCRWILPKLVDRKDAFFDALMDLIEALKIGHFKGESTLDTYFFTIYYRRCIGLQRVKKAKKNYPAQPWAGSEEVYSSLLSKEAWQKVKVRLSSIDQHLLKQDLLFLKERNSECYEILYQHVVMGYKYAEIAKKMESTENSIKVRAGKCKQKLAVIARHLDLDKN